MICVDARSASTPARLNVVDSEARRYRSSNDVICEAMSFNHTSDRGEYLGPEATISLIVCVAREEYALGFRIRLTILEEASDVTSDLPLSHAS